MTEFDRLVTKLNDAQDRISALTEQRDRLKEACEALPLRCKFTDAADYKDNAGKFDLAMDLARAALAAIPE